MQAHSHILLIDDCPQSRHDLKLILSFLGEDILFASSASWRQDVAQQLSSPEAIKCLILGQCDGDDEADGAASLITELDAWDAHLPMIVLGRERVASWPEHLRQRLLSIIEPPLNYNQLLDTLHRAQIGRAHV